MGFRGFGKGAFEAFLVEGFEERMAAIKSKVSPLLSQLGEEIVGPLQQATGEDWHPHVAAHLRRRVNPPEETWAAFSRDRKGYKRYAHLCLAINRSYLSARLSLRPESEDKATFGRGLARNLGWVRRFTTDHPALASWAGCSPGAPPRPVTEEGEEFWETVAKDLQTKKSYDLDLGFIWPRAGVIKAAAGILDRTLDVFLTLHPLYRTAVGARHAER